MSPCFPPVLLGLAAPYTARLCPIDVLTRRCGSAAMSRDDARGPSSRYPGVKTMLITGNLTRATQGCQPCCALCCEPPYHCQSRLRAAVDRRGGPGHLGVGLRSHGECRQANDPRHQTDHRRGQPGASHVAASLFVNRPSGYSWANPDAPLLSAPNGVHLEVRHHPDGRCARLFSCVLADGYDVIAK